MVQTPANDAGTESILSAGILTAFGFNGKREKAGTFALAIFLIGMEPDENTGGL